jgi:hypothetical protein
MTDADAADAMRTVGATHVTGATGESELLRPVAKCGSALGAKTRMGAYSPLLPLLLDVKSSTASALEEAVTTN